MTYLAVSDFKRGMNRLRPQVAGIPGSLWSAKNCVISRGGDIEAAKKFVPEYVLPAGTFGLAGSEGTPYVFGTAAAPAGLPVDIIYQQLVYTGSAALVEIHDARPFGAKQYVIAEFDDGDIRHFYGGVEVTEWQTVADADWAYEGVAKRLALKINERADVSAIAIGNRVKISADVPGAGFTLATSTTDAANVAASAPTAAIAHLQANVAAVAEARAVATITLTGGTNSPGVNYVSSVAVGASNLLASPVNFGLNANATANELALAITSAAVNGYSATAAGAVVTILAPPGLGGTINGTAITVSVGGNVTFSQTAFAGGVTAVAVQQQVDQVTISATSKDPLDGWKITVAGTGYVTTGRGSATGTLAHIVSRRVWVPVGPILYFCKLSDPMVWATKVPAPATDPGFVDTSLDSEGDDDIVSMAEHNDGTACFSDTNIRIYILDTDATMIKLYQSIENTGSIAAKVPLQHGSVQIYYLAMTGLASLQSRLGSNFVVTQDLASAISPYLQAYIASVGDSVVRNAGAVIEPRDGRYMLAIGDKIFLLSQYPDSDVSGWTEIDLSFKVDQFVRIGSRVMARSGDTIYVYGGLSGDVYPAAGESPIEIECPFLTASDPAGKKHEGGFDMAATGVWRVLLRVDPNDTAKTVDVGYVSKITYPKGAIKVPLATTHVAPYLTCATGGKATLSSMAIHYERGETG